MSAYLDTSALVKLLIDEPGLEAVNRLWPGVGDRYVSLVGYAELRAAVARAVRAQRVGLAASGEMRRMLEAMWQQLVGIQLDEGLVRHAADLAEQHGLGALDAIHLASALTVTTRSRRPAFVTFDQRLREAAAAEGFRVLPEVEVV